jgi:CTP:phosphocholine cytidylyltransferase-like protein/thiamine kinase-like enzyme
VVRNSRNAIILAAGKSTQFAPFTYERPKGLFRVKGEVLIERQIEQMIEAGIAQIIIVVGYMKEKFFYLERKYPQVKLVINNKFGAMGNLYSLYVARKYLTNTYVSYADYYFATNPFLMDMNDYFNRSYRACVYQDSKFDEFACSCSDAEVITSVSIGGSHQMKMLGHAYFNESFCKRFGKLLDKEIDDFRISSLFWEEFYKRHLKELTLYVKTFNQNDIFEFNSIDDLRQFDVDFLYNVDSEIISNICQTICCNPNEIKDIAVINAGLTNVSFKFRVNSIHYVYRHPGGTSGNLIDRTAEQYAQYAAKTLDIDRSMITMNLDGWKLSYCVQNLEECDFRKYDWQLQKGMDYLRKIHAMPIPINANIKTFDDYLEGIKLMKIASATKGNLLTEFADEISQAKKLDYLLKADANRLGYGLVCCHNDVYEPNFLATHKKELYLIDWEYAGLNYAANDLACFFSRYEYSTCEIEHFLSVYLQHTPTEDEHRFYVAYIALCAFYWMGWGLYKGSVGDDDGFFFLSAYRNFHRFIDIALKSYENI